MVSDREQLAWQEHESKVCKAEAVVSHAKAEFYGAPKKTYSEQVVPADTTVVRSMKFLVVGGHGATVQDTVYQLRRVLEVLAESVYAFCVVIYCHFIQAPALDGMGLSDWRHFQATGRDPRSIDAANQALQAFRPYMGSDYLGRRARYEDFYNGTSAEREAHAAQRAFDETVGDTMSAFDVVICTYSSIACLP